MAKEHRYKEAIVLRVIQFAKRLFYNTPVHRLKWVNFVYDRLFHFAYPAGHMERVRYEGGVFNIPTDDITILPSILNDNYEKYEIALLRHLLRPGMTLADVGANIGIFSVVAGQSVGHRGRVFAFEPEPGNFAVLKENLVANGLANVTAVNTAVGAKKDILKLNIEAGSIGTHSLLTLPGKTISRQIEVPIVALDEYFAGQNAWPEVIKIDVEGYEPFVLEGARKTLAKADAVLFEFIRDQVRSNYGVDKFVALLDVFPYLYRIDESKHVLKLVDRADFSKIKYMNVLAAKSRQVVREAQRQHNEP